MTDYAFSRESRLWLPSTGLGRIPLLYSPVGLWHFNGDRTDSSGNGHDFGSTVGTMRYIQIRPGMAGAYFRGTYVRVDHSDLRITGDVTLALLMQLHAYPTGSTMRHYLIGCGQEGSSSESENTMYSINLLVAGGIRWWSEHGSGVSDLFPTGYLMPMQTWGLLIGRRASNIVTFSWNGEQLGAASSALTTPTGGSGGGLAIGSAPDAAADGEFSCGGAAVWASALTDDQITTLTYSVLGTEIALTV